VRIVDPLDFIWNQISGWVVAMVDVLRVKSNLITVYTFSRVG